MQSVTPTGVAPEQETLRAASHTAMAAPRRGSRKTWRPLPSVDTASARGVPFTRRTAASEPGRTDRKSTRLNSSHSQISYAVFCLKKKKKTKYRHGLI